MSLVTKLIGVSVALAVVASLAGCGSGGGSSKANSTTVARSASTKTETFRWSRPPAPDLYLQFQGPSEVVSIIRRHFPVPAHQMVAVHKPVGPRACSISAGGVTIRLYGNKNSTSFVCKLVKKGLAKS